MMNYSLIIPAFFNEHFLKVRIAGLTLIDRLFHEARKCGIQKVFVLCSNPDSLKPLNNSVQFVNMIDELKRMHQKSSIILKCGYLPDALFFESLLKSIDGKFSCLSPHYPSILVVKENNNTQKLKKLWDKNGFDSLYDEFKNSPFSKVLDIKNGNIYDTRSPERIFFVENQLFKDLIKDTEGFMSRHFERKISIAISKRLVETSITPNQITVISMLIGLSGAFFMGISRGLWQILGSILFLTHSIMDGCDGEIARIKFSESRLGGLLDFWGDNVVHSVVFIAIAWEWWNRTRAFFPLLLAMFAVLGCLASAGMVYWKTMRFKNEKGPLYTHVSSLKEKNKLKEIADFLSRRDFIYLVVILSFFKHLDWFLICSSLGTPAFLLILLWLHTKESRG